MIISHNFFTKKDERIKLLQYTYSSVYTRIIRYIILNKNIVLNNNSIINVGIFIIFK